MNKKNKKIELSQIVLLMVISGIFGYIYEVIFYKIDLGVFVNRGITWGPWIPIYAIGSLLILWLTYKYKNKPLLVFLISFFATGILEFLSGYMLNHLFNLKLWNYYTEIWNFGNLYGYVCLRSVMFFGLSGLLLIYVIVPIVKKLYNIIPYKRIKTISYLLGILFLIDVVINSLLIVFNN